LVLYDVTTLYCETDTRRWCETGYNITHWTTLPRGGRFAAFEQPELFVEDVNAFFEKVR